MNQQQKDMSGVLFKNGRKEQPNHPDYKGSAMVNGQDMWISAWIKPTRDGTGRFMSLAFTPKDKRAAPPQPVRQDRQQPRQDVRRPPADDDFDDRPF